jgi:NAD(P)-dependent dehydrogenase (short-subunit alcohol dehydrogenase family)
MAADGPRRHGGPGSRHALVIGGTGMLVACASMLVAEGWQVVLPSRRYAPIPSVPSAANSGSDGRALWVAADLSDPDGLAERAGKALGGPVELLVTWVRREHRRGLLGAVEPLLAPDAPVVEVHGSAAFDPVGGYPDPVLPDHPTQQVVLGFVPVGRTSRRLNHEEISGGVLDAVDRALAGKTPGVYQVGEPRPWSMPN